MEDEQDQYENDIESSDESYRNDDNLRESTRSSISDRIPEDAYQVTQFVVTPESEYRDKINKDTTLAHWSGDLPDRESTSFLLQTVQMIEGVFTKSYKSVILNKDGTPIMVENLDENGDLVQDKKYVPLVRTVTMFDEENFSFLHRILNGKYQFDTVSSRGVGKEDRASMLLISNINRINKEFAKKQEKKSSIMGVGN